MSAPIIVSSQHRAVVVPWQAAIANLIPDAKGLVIDGNAMLAVRHGTDQTRLLRSMHLPVPSPILYHYDWANALHKPYTVQRHTCAMLTMNRRAYVLNGFGTGKTKCALWSADFLRKQGEVRRVLVVAPLSTLTFTWAKEIMATVPHMRCTVLHGTRSKRIVLCKQDSDVFIVNHEGLEIVAAALLDRGDIDLVVLDELAKYRNGGAAITKTTAKFVKQIPWVWGMTGGPTPNEPPDAHAQVRMLTPHMIDASKMRFREATMIKVSSFKWVAKANALDIVHAAMQPSVRFTIDDVVELPELIMRIVDVQQGQNQTSVYRSLVNDAFVQFKAGAITAINEAALRTKLLQVASGWVYTTNRGIEKLDNNARLDVLTDVIAQTQRKVIVFAPYTHCIAGLNEHITKAGYTTAVIEGDVSKPRRDDIFNRFQNTTEPKVLVAHPGTMAHGLTLTAADTIIWFGPPPSLEVFDQANARISRIGQKHKQMVLMFAGTEIERKEYNRLRNKQTLQNTLLQMFEDGTINNL